MLTTTEMLKISSIQAQRFARGSRLAYAYEEDMRQSALEKMLRVKRRFLADRTDKEWRQSSRWSYMTSTSKSACLDFLRRETRYGAVHVIADVEPEAPHYETPLDAYLMAEVRDEVIDVFIGAMAIMTPAEVEVFRTVAFTADGKCSSYVGSTYYSHLYRARDKFTTIAANQGLQWVSRDRIATLFRR